jgi:hypothetical protein
MRRVVLVLAAMALALLLASGVALGRGSEARGSVLRIHPTGNERVLRYLLRKVGTRPDCWRLVSHIRRKRE